MEFQLDELEASATEDEPATEQAAAGTTQVTEGMLEHGITVEEAESPQEYVEAVHKLKAWNEESDRWLDMGHGIYSTMERRNPHYRAVVADALAGRSVAGSATSHGLPRDAIRRVLQGHDPRLSRAEDICRALGITFTIGASGIPPPDGHADVSGVGDSASASERDSYVTRAEGTAPGRDPRLSALLDRLSERWDVLDAPERKRLQAAIVAILELSGASEGRR